MSSDSVETGNESFASMFESEAKSKPKRGVVRQLRPGESIEGVVVRVSKDTVFLSFDGKQEGFLELTELTDVPALGDKLRAIVIGEDGGSTRLGRVAPKGRGAEGLMQAQAAGLPVEGLVTGVNKGGLEVELNGVRAFCPARQADMRFVSDLAPFIGQKLKFLVMQVKDNGREVVLSRRGALEIEAREARAKIDDKLVAGAVLQGKVTAIQGFGAFVDLGGVEGLLPASELSHDRGVRPQDVLKIGDEVQVQLLRLENDEKRPGQQRITLSLKALASDPWESVAPTLEENSVREGRVIRHAAFGAFVQIAPGLDGLLHLSEVPTQEGKPAQLPEVGTTISVRILKVDIPSHRVSLGLGDGPVRTPTAPRRASTATPGSIVKGKVTGVERFGVFVQLDGSGQRGLLPANEVMKDRTGDLHKIFPVGMEITAKIVSVDGNRIRLSVSAMKADEERASYEDFQVKERDRAGTTLSALGQKLAAAGLLDKGKAKGKTKPKK